MHVHYVLGTDGTNIHSFSDKECTKLFIPIAPSFGFPDWLYNKLKQFHADEIASYVNINIKSTLLHHFSDRSFYAGIFDYHVESGSLSYLGVPSFHQLVPTSGLRQYQSELRLRVWTKYSKILIKR